MTPLEFKLWRVARGLNQREAARLFGVSQAAVSNWETLKPVVQVRPRITKPVVPVWVVERIAQINRGYVIRIEDESDAPEDETEGQWADREFGPDSGFSE